MTSSLDPTSRPRCHALVPCAGVGERAGVGGPKQYHPVAGRAVILHTLDALTQVARLSQILVVLSPGDTQFDQQVPPGRAEVARCGGASRAASVAAGLEVLAERGAAPDDWVLVHDAARCLLRPSWVERLIDACEDDPVGGLLALPVADTLKQAEQGRARHTVSRQDKWVAQTPQMFRLGTLRQALAAAGAGVTDEASAIEHLGLAPRLVRGDLENLKLTWPEDFALAERLLATRSPPAADTVGAGAVEALLLAQELALMDPERHRDPLLGAMLADDALEIGRSGSTHDAAAMRRWLAQPERPRYRVSSFSTQTLAPDLVLARYQAERLDAHERVASVAWRSSVWGRGPDGRWRLRAHQGTPVDSPAPSTPSARP